jgi:predicted nucleic acid-binding protein
LDRLFLDANILFSAAYREGAGLTRLWQVATATLLTSPYAIEEARRNLDSDDQRARLDALLPAVELIGELSADEDLAQQSGLPEKDIPILLAAIAGQATYLLTGDVRHFGPLFGTTICGVHIQLPADYLRDKTAA